MRTSKRNYSKIKFDIQEDSLWLRLFIIAVIAGSIIGTYSAFVINADNANIYTDSITINEILKVFIRLSKFTITIWLCSLLKNGRLIATLLLMLKGGSLAFCSALIGKTYGISGIPIAIVIFIPQAVAFIPMLIRLSIIGTSLHTAHRPSLKVYFLWLILCELTAFILAFAEVIICRIYSNFLF